MKNTGIIVFFVLLAICSLNSSAQTPALPYPPYREVVARFMEGYSTAAIPNTSQLSFQKKPDGWHICITDYSGAPLVTNDILFWDSKTAAYMTPDFPKALSSQENLQTMEGFLQSWDAINFDISPYYGYMGWDKDVISLLQEKENLSDTLLYALGRAYSSYAGNLLHNNSGYAISSEQFVLADTRNCMSAEQLATYRKYRHLAIAKFKELAQRNPQFETIVGRIGVKAANEHMTSYLDLYMYQNAEEAKKEVPDNIYNDYMLAAARNYLLSCPENAILFTNGDNDTYPLLYLQLKKGFRKDVKVVNLSLLQTSRYIRLMSEKDPDSGALPITFTSEQLSGSRRDVIVITGEKEKMELNEMISFLKDDNHVMTYGPATYYYIPSAKLYFKPDSRKMMEFRITNSYFLLNQLVFYDVLAANRFKRPICFALTVGEDQFFGMNDYMRLNGMVYIVDPEKYTNSNYGLGSVHTSMMYELLTGKFDKTLPVQPGTFEKITGMNYRNIHYRLAEALIAEDKKDKAEEILDLGCRLLPDSVLYYDFYMIPFVDYYYQLGKFEKGNRIAEVIIYNLKKGLLNEYHLIRSATPDVTYILQYMGELADKYGQKEIMELTR